MISKSYLCLSDKGFVHLKQDPITIVELFNSQLTTHKKLKGFWLYIFKFPSKIQSLLKFYMDLAIPFWVEEGQPKEAITDLRELYRINSISTARTRCLCQLFVHCQYPRDLSESVNMVQEILYKLLGDEILDLIITFCRKNEIQCDNPNTSVQQV